ncbi:MAG: hypothetical protein GKR97_20825 [Rhizobiaceae bacterium]|nr:hypothetical protein [Rhizobiaceae bacterium]
MTDDEPEKNQYNYLHDNMSIEAWAWEFIRRDPAYHKAWARYASYPVTAQTRQDIPLIARDETAAATRFGLLFFP